MSSLNPKLQTAREIDDSTKVHNRFNSLNYALPTPKIGGVDTVDDVSDVCEKMLKDGYAIVPDMLTAEQVAELKKVSYHLLETTPTGRNVFEGLCELLMVPKLERILNKMLVKNYLLTAFQCIEILPEEKQQLLHFDDQFVHMPRPRPYTKDGFVYKEAPVEKCKIKIKNKWSNTSHTKLLLFFFLCTLHKKIMQHRQTINKESHLWDDNRIPGKDDPTVAMEMKPGSALLLLSTTWHGGGPNSTSHPRLAVTAQFCQPWIRPQENQFLSVPFDMVLKMHPKIQSLLGYSIHFPFIGHSNGLHPLKALKHKFDDNTILFVKLLDAIISTLLFYLQIFSFFLLYFVFSNKTTPCHKFCPNKTYQRNAIPVYHNHILVCDKCKQKN
ncbi:phytanoyl-CoA dioxygenase (PhyH) family protein [Reticulomyxa filosa]|uniref:Phytanoyl-CoA dioxygenase (PhyH) family protein n=1 Tax=Reticulomyxa filosa TaxID=46433 RepID=X6NKX2_RETFI|nr:phytanoyl-CoA dioxygenase (PhyH) family protein [Reticulomyxa filosa]|eukprot:ETO26568.1 phytanoyl-CoA dioxygenase (PhyH) family protein [Reticulomyxa filosa]